MKQYLIFFFRIIPKGLISRLFGVIMRIPFPEFLLTPAIKWYCGKYGVREDEISFPPEGFKTFDDFFTRELKNGCRNIDGSQDSIVSSVDAVISYFGRINNYSIIQAKGIEYSLAGLVPSDTADAFIDGDFITLYLSPGDYHRIHSPVSGRITGFFNIPGKLFTVQEFMVNGLKGLFTLNERVISYIKNENGLTAVCKVGAMNVGRITLSHAGVVTNRTFRRRRETFYGTDQQPSVLKGELLGTFHLGSTVILLFQKDMIKFEELKIGQPVRMGERIAKYK